MRKLIGLAIVGILAFPITVEAQDRPGDPLFLKYCRLAKGKIVKNTRGPGRWRCVDGYPDGRVNVAAYRATYGVDPAKKAILLMPGSKAAAAREVAKYGSFVSDTKKSAVKGQVTSEDKLLRPVAPAKTPVVATKTVPATVAPAGEISGGSIGKRVALVVGNSRYKGISALANPVRDAAIVAELFRRLGFHTVVLENDLTREKFMSALQAFGHVAEGADWSVIYFAGHGAEINGVNYLLPVDAKFATDKDVQFEAIALDHVLAAAERAQKLRIVILDACRDNPFLQQMRRSVAARSIGRGLASVEPEAGTLVVFAAKHREIALDGEGENSPFVAALTRHLEVPGIEVRRLFDLVRDDVMATTNKRQQPYTYGSLPGREDFYFVSADKRKEP